MRAAGRTPLDLKRVNGGQPSSWRSATARPFRVVEYTAYSIWCQDCGCYHPAPLPPHLVKAGLFGPRLTSLDVYLKGRIHASYTGIRDFFQDVVGVKVSRGYVAKLLRKASQAFGEPYGELVELLPQQTHLNSDESGHKDNGQRYWIGCFRAASFVLFKIDPSRGAEVLMRLLGGNFKGILGCDYYAAYRKYARQCSVLVQFCLAHLIREVKYLCEFPDPQSSGTEGDSWPASKRCSGRGTARISSAHEPFKQNSTKRTTRSGRRPFPPQVARITG